MAFRDFLASMREALNRAFSGALGAAAPAERFRRRARLLYGRGEIGEDVFLRLLGEVERGYSIEAELAGLERAARRARPPDLLPHAGADAARQLEGVYLQRARLAELRAAVQSVIGALESEAGWANRLAAEGAARAQEPGVDDETARLELSMQARLLDRVGVLEGRVRDLRADLRRLDHLAVELRIAETDLRLARTRESLALEGAATSDLPSLDSPEGDMPQLLPGEAADPDLRAVVDEIEADLKRATDAVRQVGGRREKS